MVQEVRTFNPDTFQKIIFCQFVAAGFASVLFEHLIKVWATG
jgi:hypothetical protein